MSFLVDLRGVEDVKKFVKKAEKYECDIMVKNRGRAFRVDGSSIMGIFSLNLMEPVVVHIEDDKIAEKFKEDVIDFVIKKQEENEC